MFRTTLKYGVMVALLLLPAAVSAQETQDTAKLAPELNSARTAWQQATSKLAAADAAAHFADDVLVQFGNDEFRGRQAAGGFLSQAMQGLMALRLEAATFMVAEKEVVERAQFTVASADGGQQGAVELVWRKDAEGKWKIARLSVF